MSNNNNAKFFQNEKKFVVGNIYETIRVKDNNYHSSKQPGYSIETCDEFGDVIEGSELYLGKYVKSWRYGYGDGGGRCDTFTNNNGVDVSHYLDYDGTTRYREIKTLMDERVNYLMVAESTGHTIHPSGKEAHIIKFVLNEEIIKEVCSFMNPLLKQHDD